MFMVVFSSRPASKSKNNFLVHCLLLLWITQFIACEELTSVFGEEYKGKSLGKLNSYHHQVNADVYAIDEYTLLLAGFTYDGTEADTFFWAGSTARPGPQGFIIPNEYGKTDVLTTYVNKDIRLTLPDKKKLRDIKWVAVYDLTRQSAFGDVYIPEEFEPPLPQVISEITGRSHGITSGSIEILDAKTLLIPEFTYNGANQDTYFWVGVGPQPSSKGSKVPDERGYLDSLRIYTEETITLELPGDLTIFDIDWFSIYDVANKQNLGSVIIPDEPNVPPSLAKIASYKSTLPNCIQLHRNMQASWEIFGPQITIQLAGFVDENEYMAFGQSGSIEKPLMLGSDITIAYINGHRGFAVDYNITAKSSCVKVLGQYKGVCQDSLVGGTDDNQLHTAIREEGINVITYRRKLISADPGDKEYKTEGFSQLLWAIGELYHDKEPAMHYAYPRGTLKVELHKKEPIYTCTPFVKRLTTQKVEIWERHKIIDRTTRTLVASLGPPGGMRGYKGITGMPSSGLVWYINGKMSPEIWIQRGLTYSIYVHGGNNPHSAEYYNPFIITDEPHGGYERLNEQAQKQVKVLAGVQFTLRGQPRPIAAGPLCLAKHKGVDQRMDDIYPTFAKFNRTLTYSCETGEPSILDITPNSSWPDIVYYNSYTRLNTDRKRICGHPAVPVNAQVTVSSDDFGPGSKATYKCDDGYELFGADTTLCLESGLWSGELPFCGINVATKKPANQSSTVRGGAATNANDGEKTTVHDGKRCTETMKETSPWWQVDLLRAYPIRVIRVTTRGCCGHQPLQDLEIRVGNSSSELQRNPLCAWFPGTIEEGSTKSFTCARTLVGQYVFLQLVGSEGSLSLCEVEVFTTDEFSSDHCAPAGVSNDVEFTSFNRICYEFNVVKGASFDFAREKCKKNNGDLIHGFKGVTTSFILAELERRKEKLKTQLVWIGAQKEPGVVVKTWKWVDGEVIGRPHWGKDQPNNYNGEQNCVVLDGGRNWLWNDVGCNLDYLHWICQHKPTSCGSPDKKVNTTIIGKDQHIGAIIEYQCPIDYVLVGDKQRTCTEQGFWSGQAPTCEYVNCGSLPDIDNGTVTIISNRTTYGAEAVYKCNANYTLLGKNIRTCGGDGVWTGQQPQCLYDWCPDPPQVQGGLISLDGKRAGSKAVYSCLPGYVLLGHQEIVCDVGGQWSGKAPVCRYIDCGAPSIIDNGRYHLINETTTYGSVVEYACNEDYWLEPQNRKRQMCTREGHWSPDHPTCELITCGEPEVPPGGYVTGYDFNIHSKIEFHCEPGYLLVGQSEMICTAQGEWNDTSPTCEYIDCGKLPPLLYGSIHYLNNTTHLGAQVTYNCTRNYKLIGTPVRTCLPTRVWSGVSAKCEEIRCPEPELPTHAIISVTGNDRVYGRTLIRTSNDAPSQTTYKIGALVKYRCERGHKILGDPLSTCEENGQWSGEIPHCDYVDCGTPEEIENGNFMLPSNVTYYGSAVLYECKPGYKLDGHDRRLCLENGTWNSDPPKCLEIICEDPEVGESMSVKVEHYTVGGIAQYTCNKGFFMEGNSTRECTRKGHWTGEIPVCKPVICGYPSSIDNGRVIVINETVSYNSIVEYHCIPRYELVGPFIRKCTETGKWSSNEPKCEVRTASESRDSQATGFFMSAGAGALILLFLLGIFYLRLKKPKPIKNTENIQGANKKEEEGAAAMSYASLSDGNASNIYEHIPENFEGAYDVPYEGFSHYEPSPNCGRDGAATVTINGVAVR